MAAKRLTQIFPFLLPLRRWQRKVFFYAKMRFDKNVYAKRRLDTLLPHSIYSVSSVMINRRSGFPIEYQYNKAHNLALASKTMQHVIIRPGQTFSFYQLVRKADKREHFKDGLVLENGRLKTSYGGGLCQLSSLLFQLFLHSPLVITERHAHARETLPPAQPEETVGLDAAVSEGWLDLKAYNPTQSAFQLEFELDQEYIHIRLLSDSPPQYWYKVFNSKLSYFYREARLFRNVQVSRIKTDIYTNTQTQELLFSEECEICYPADNIPQELIESI